MKAQLGPKNDAPLSDGIALLDDDVLVICGETTIILTFTPDELLRVITTLAKQMAHLAAKAAAPTATADLSRLDAKGEG
jgi:hypothetical protein